MGRIEYQFREEMMLTRQNLNGSYQNLSLQESTALATVASLKKIDQGNVGKISTQEQNNLDHKISNRLQRVFGSIHYKSGMQKISQIGPFQAEEIV